jgi:hypothetical protein
MEQELDGGYHSDDLAYESIYCITDIDGFYRGRRGLWRFRSGTMYIGLGKGTTSPWVFEKGFNGSRGVQEQTDGIWDRGALLYIRPFPFVLSFRYISLAWGKKGCCGHKDMAWLSGGRRLGTPLRGYPVHRLGLLTYHTSHSHR